jgi:hypothetical protein
MNKPINILGKIFYWTNTVYTVYRNIRKFFRVKVYNTKSSYRNTVYLKFLIFLNS